MSLKVWILLLSGSGRLLEQGWWLQACPAGVGAEILALQSLRVGIDCAGIVPGYDSPSFPFKGGTFGDL